jgi:ribosomal protein S12 methylthiotransferase accessory factor
MVLIMNTSEIRITFPGGKRVEAHLGSRVIKTDQSPAHGGDGSAPEPYDLFLASIGACAGAYVLGFCQARGIRTTDISIGERLFFDDAQTRLERVELELAIPDDFPEKYRAALLRAVEGCKVKRTLASPPEISVKTTSIRPSRESQIAGEVGGARNADEGDVCDESP